MPLPTSPGGMFSHQDLRDPRVPFTGRVPGQGERELGFIALGERYWLPSSEAKARIRVYADAEEFLDPACHLDLYIQTFPRATPPEEANWIPIDFPGMLSRLMRHYTFGPDFRVAADREETAPEINRIFRASRLASLLSQVAEAATVDGDAVLRIDVEDLPTLDVSPESDAGPDDTVPQAVVRYVHPAHYFPEFDPFDATRVRSVTLAWVFPRPEDRTDIETPMVVLREVHTPGRVDYMLNTWDGVETGRELVVDSMFPELEDGETGIDEIPIVHVAKDRRAGKHWGCSEFMRVLRIILALENRFAQEDEALERHARPKLIVGPGVLDPQGRARLADFDVIEIDPSILEKAVKPEYLTWDMQIQGIQHEIEKLEEYLFITTETSPASFGLERDGSQVESARALRFKAHRTVNKVQDFRVELDDDLQGLFRIAQKLELAAREEDGMEAYARTGVHMVWPDPIIEDQTQEVLDYSTLKGTHLVSRKRSVMDLFQLTPEEADAEVQEILQDMVDEGAAASGGRQPGLPPEAGPPPAAPPAPGEEPPAGVQPGATA